MAIGALIFFLFIAAIVLAVVWAVKQTKKNKLAEAEQRNKQAAQVQRWAENPHEKEQHDREVAMKKLHFSGRLIMGHPDINEPTDTNVRMADGTLMIFQVGPNNQLGKPIGGISLDLIQAVNIEDASTIEKRITATRLLAVGIFALAAKKKEVHPRFYVSIEWNGLGFPHSTTFEFEGANANVNASTFRNSVMRACQVEA